MRSRQFVVIANVVAVALASGLLAEPAAGAAQSTSRWSIQPSPNPPGSAGSFLAAVSCAGDGTCTAVGSYSPSAGIATLAERWDGSSWTIETTPNPAGASSLLTGVSCPGPTSCMAVGYSVSTKVRPLVERWNGISWKILSTPRPGRAWWYELTDVSCPGTGDCTAVGGAIGRGVDAQERPLAEHWGGGSWTIQRTPNPHAENGSDLTAVSCPATGVCEAAGGYTFADVEDSIFALGWNGSKWTIQAQPDPGGGFVTENDAVSCATGMACTSTGSWADEQGRTRALGETWDGTSWTLRNAKDPSGSTIAELLGVACAGAAECIAVGDWSTSYNGTPSSTLGERWNGTAWRVQSTPNPKGSTFSSLRGVECASTGACVAVGSSHVDGVDATLVEVYTP